MTIKWPICEIGQLTNTCVVVCSNNICLLWFDPTHFWVISNDRCGEAWFSGKLEAENVFLHNSYMYIHLLKFTLQHPQEPADPKYGFVRRSILYKRCVDRQVRRHLWYIYIYCYTCIHRVHLFNYVFRVNERCCHN